jgi:hypothetical protein
MRVLNKKGRKAHTIFVGVTEKPRLIFARYPGNVYCMTIDVGNYEVQFTHPELVSLIQDVKTLVETENLALPFTIL